MGTFDLTSASLAAQYSAKLPCRVTFNAPKTLTMTHVIHHHALLVAYLVADLELSHFGSLSYNFTAKIPTEYQWKV